jgi:hypothetical protein
LPIHWWPAVRRIPVADDPTTDALVRVALRL